jgi:hypothetical protein
LEDPFNVDCLHELFGLGGGVLLKVFTEDLSFVGTLIRQEKRRLNHIFVVDVGSNFIILYPLHLELLFYLLDSCNFLNETANSDLPWLVTGRFFFAFAPQPVLLDPWYQMLEFHLLLLLEHLHGQRQRDIPIPHDHYRKPITNTNIDYLLVPEALHQSWTRTRIPIQNTELVLIVISPAIQAPLFVNRSEVGGMGNDLREFDVLDRLFFLVDGLEFDGVPCLLVEFPAVVLD